MNQPASRQRARPRLQDSMRLYLWVLIAILLGGLLGYIHPDFAVTLKPLGDGFIALLKMLIGPVIFCTIVLGIYTAGDLKKVGRVGFKALVYFEIVSTLALIIGLMIVNWIKPGIGFNADLASLDTSTVSDYVKKASDQTTVGFILHVIPKSFVDAFTGNGDLLQILLLALLFGYAMNHMGEKSKPVFHFIESASHIFFSMVNSVMKLAPIGAGASMAYTIGKFGLSALGPLLKFMGLFYLSCGLFIFVVLGAIAKASGFNIFRLIIYIREELLTVLGTSSSEAALVPLMRKLEGLGCSKSVVGLVVPAGYSFNLDGTSIYLTMAVLFIAQAFNIDLSWAQQLSILGVALLTSKGASGVTGAGFITLAATLAVVPGVPIAGLALILGVDRFMSEARAITNFIGNSVATIAVAKLENELDHSVLARELSSSKI